MSGFVSPYFDTYDKPNFWTKETQLLFCLYVTYCWYSAKPLKSLINIVEVYMVTERENKNKTERANTM